VLGNWVARHERVIAMELRHTTGLARGHVENVELTGKRRIAPEPEENLASVRRRIFGDEPASEPTIRNCDVDSLAFDELGIDDGVYDRNDRILRTGGIAEVVSRFWWKSDLTLLPEDVRSYSTPSSVLRPPSRA
jgi:hypothetical protein